MSKTLELDPDSYEKLEQLAAAEGKTVEQTVCDIIVEKTQ